MLKLALRNVFRHKLRTSMTVGAIVMGVVGLILSGGFVADILVELGEAVIHSQSGHIQVAREGYFTVGSRSPEQYLMDRPEAYRRVALALPGIEDVMTRVSFTGLLSNGRSDFPVAGEGVEPEKESRLGRLVTIVNGRDMTNTDTYGILIGRGVAETLDLKPADRVMMVVSTAEGALNTLDFEVVGVFQTFLRDFDSRAVRISIAAAQELINTTGANVLVLSLKKTSDTDVFASRLRTALGHGIEVRTWYELNDFYAKAVEMYRYQFGALRIIVLLLVLLSVSNSVNMATFERTGEFGTMMAIGTPNARVFRLILTENLILGVLGALLGVVLGMLVAVLVSVVGIPMPPPPNTNIGYTAQIRILPYELLISFSIGVSATAFAAILPAVRTIRTPVVNALRQNV